MNKYFETKQKCSRMAVFQMVYIFWNDNFHAVSACIIRPVFLLFKSLEISVPCNVRVENNTKIL